MALPKPRLPTNEIAPAFGLLLSPFVTRDCGGRVMRRSTNVTLSGNGSGRPAGGSWTGQTGATNVQVDLPRCLRPDRRNTGAVDGARAAAAAGQHGRPGGLCVRTGQNTGWRRLRGQNQ